MEQEKRDMPKKGKFIRLIRDLFSSKRFRKLLLGYAAVFMLPLVLLYLWIIHGAVADKRVSLENEALERLSTIASMIEQKLDYAEYIAFDVGENANLRPSRLRSGVSSEIEGISDLGKYTVADDFWEDIYYIFGEGDKVYTTHGLMDWDVMTQMKFHISPEEAALLDEQVKTMLSASMADEKSIFKGDQIIYLQSIKRPLVNYSGVLMCEVSDEKLLDILNLFNEPACAIYVADAEGNVLYVRRPTGEWPQETILEQLPGHSGVTEIIADGRRFSGVSYAAGTDCWRYTAVIPTDIFQREALEMQKVVMSLLAVVFLLGACLMSVLTWTNYRPIRMMRDIAFREMPELEDRQLDDLDAVREMVDHSLEQRSELEFSIQEQKQQIVQQTLRHLLSGFRAEDMPILLRAMNAADLRLSHGKMCVFLISRVDGVNPCGRDEAARLKNGFDNTHFQIYTYPWANLGALAVIASYHEGEQLQLAQLLYREAMLVSEELVLAVSDECTELTRLAGALNQACEALSWARESAVSGVVFFSEIEGAGDGLARMKREYLQALHQGGEEHALLCAENLIGQVTSNHSYEFARMVLCELIVELNNLCCEYRVNVPEADRKTDMRFSSFEELRQMFIHMTREIADVMTNRRTAHEAGRGEELIAFVDAHFRNADLSLKMLADHFDMSANYVSRVFREIAGKGFSEYVSELRMQYVKEKLGNSLEPIKDVILSAGYRDVPNFMRKFKQTVGTTPGEYRKNILQTEDD